VQRLRFEHPGVRTVVVTIVKDKIFFAVANILMLAASPHRVKVNFASCAPKRDRNGDRGTASLPSGQTYRDPLSPLHRVAASATSFASLPAITLFSSATSLGGVPCYAYPSSLVSLPRPFNRSGLTSGVDQRHVRRYRADYFFNRNLQIWSPSSRGSRKASQPETERVFSKARHMSSKLGC